MPTATSITPRERVLTALRHRQPDVCPWQIDLTIDARQQTADYLDDPDFVSKIGNHLSAYGDGWFEEVRPGYWRDQFGIVWNRTVDKDIGIVDEYLIREPDVSTYRFPEPDLERNAAGLEALVSEHPDQFRVAQIGFSMFERAWTLRSMTELLMDMIVNPSFVHDLMNRILAYNMQAIEQMLEYDVDCIYFGDD